MGVSFISPVPASCGRNEVSTMSVARLAHHRWHLNNFLVKSLSKRIFIFSLECHRCRMKMEIELFVMFNDAAIRSNNKWTPIKVFIQCGNTTFTKQLRMLSLMALLGEEVMVSPLQLLVIRLYINEYYMQIVSKP